MRILTWALVCAFSGALGAAMADEPSKAPAPAPASSPEAASTDAAPPASAPPSASAPAAATSASKPTLSEEQLDKHFRSEGYSVQMRNGEKKYCKKEEVLGSRLQGGTYCWGGLELLMKERKAQDDLSAAQRIMGHPNN